MQNTVAGSLVSFRSRLASVAKLVSLPIRLQYAHYQGQYALACDKEACLHYGENSSKLWRVRCYISGFINAIICNAIPKYFVDRVRNVSSP